MLASEIAPTICLLPPLRALLAKFLTRMVPCGLEPRTLRLLAVRSNQLSYETVGVMGLAELRDEGFGEHMILL